MVYIVYSFLSIHLDNYHFFEIDPQKKILLLCQKLADLVGRGAEDPDATIEEEIIEYISQMKNGDFFFQFRLVNVVSRYVRHDNVYYVHRLFLWSILIVFNRK